jgi:hypothetical protein
MRTAITARPDGAPESAVVGQLTTLFRELSADSRRLTTLADACRALDRVTTLRRLVVGASACVGSDVLSRVDVVVCVAGQLGGLVDARGTGAGPGLGPAETREILVLASETLSLSARLALSIVHRIRRDRLRRLLPLVIGWAARVLLVEPVELYVQVLAVLGVTSAPHCTGVLLAVVHLLIERRTPGRDVLAGREPVETTPRSRRGHRHGVFTR